MINDFTGLSPCAPHADMEKQTGRISPAVLPQWAAGNALPVFLFFFFFFHFQTFSLFLVLLLLMSGLCWFNGKLHQRKNVPLKLIPSQEIYDELPSVYYLNKQNMTLHLRPLA